MKDSTPAFTGACHCGAIGFTYRTRLEPSDWFGIIKLHAVRPMPAGLPEPAAMAYGSESRAQRITRREERWSPVRSVVGPRGGLPEAG